MVDTPARKVSTDRTERERASGASEAVGRAPVTLTNRLEGDPYARLREADELERRACQLERDAWTLRYRAEQWRRWARREMGRDHG